MQRISENSKIKAGRGTGEGANYKPWIKIREINSIGTASSIVDYKHGREIQLLSQAEVYYYYLLRWDDDVIDIREQFPLDLGLTHKLCDKLGFVYPKNRLTTDLLVSKRDGSLIAYSVKTDKSVLNNPRTVEKLTVEKIYWESQGIKFKLVFKEDVNKILVNNIMDVISNYDANSICDDFSQIRYKIAHKEIVVNMDTKPLDYNEILKNIKNL